MIILLIVLLCCSIIVFVFSLIKVVKVEVVTQIPLNSEDAVSFSSIKDGKYKVWLSGPRFRKFPDIYERAVQVFDQATNMMLELKPAMSRQTSSNFSTESLYLYHVTLLAGTYYVKIGPIDASIHNFISSPHVISLTDDDTSFQYVIKKPSQ